MALIEGFESLSGTPAVPAGWSVDAGTNAAGSASSVTEGVQSWQWSGTVTSALRHDGSVTGYDATGATIISIDVDVVSLSAVPAGIRLIVERPASKETAQDTVTVTGATTLDVDVSGFSALDGLTISPTVDAAISNLTYVVRWDNLRDGAVAGGWAGVIMGATDPAEAMGVTAANIDNFMDVDSV